MCIIVGIIVSVTLSGILSAAITIKITAKAMRNMEKHVDEICDINLESCKKTQEITLNAVDKLSNTGFDK